MDGDRGRVPLAPHHLPRRPEAGRLRRARTAGRTRPPTSATCAPSTGRPTASSPCSARCCRWSSCGVPFSVSRATIDDASRGAQRLDLDELEAAVRTLGEAENAARLPRLRRRRHRRASPRSRRTTPSRCRPTSRRIPTSVAKAVNTLRVVRHRRPVRARHRAAGFTAIIESTERGGLLLLDHLRQILGGPVVWAPGVEGAVVLSLRGGDFVLDCGEDLSIGYLAARRRARCSSTSRRASASTSSSPTPPSPSR